LALTWWHIFAARCRASDGGLAEDAQVGARWGAARPVPFTPAQYEELEQQALIYKYLVAGVPVPPDLVLPIRRGLDSLATRFYGHPTRTASSSPESLPYCFPGACFLPGLFVYSDQVYFAWVS
jgi:hypothetical protein